MSTTSTIINIPTMEAIEQMFDAKFQRFEAVIQRLTTMKEDEEQWINQKNAAALLGISQATLIRWKKGGKINTYRVDGCQRYKRSEILSFFNKSNF